LEKDIHEKIAAVVFVKGSKKCTVEDHSDTNLKFDTAVCAREKHKQDDMVYDTLSVRLIGQG